MVCFSTMSLMYDNILSQCQEDEVRALMIQGFPQSSLLLIIVGLWNNLPTYKSLGGHISDLNHTSCRTVESEMEGSGYN